MKTANSSQGTVYLELEEISKYKYFVVSLSGTVNEVSVGLAKDVSIDQYTTEIHHAIIGKYTADVTKTIDAQELIYTDKFSRVYYLFIYGTYFNNLQITVKGVLK